MRNFEIRSNKSKEDLTHNLYLSSKFLSYSKTNIVYIYMCVCVCVCGVSVCVCVCVCVCVVDYESM